MAQTKVKLVSNGVITVDNLHTNHGITTDHIGEGTNKFFTDARVQTYLTSNNYIKTTDVASLETVTSISLSANTLSYVDEAGNTTNLDLSLYLDDTNLARLVSGTLDGGTGIATFTRDDASTFTVDFSAFLSDANDYVTSASFNTADGVLTLTRLGGGTVTVDLDNRYLTSFTETDPIYTASSWYTTTNNSSNWDTAFGWGNHASAGYLTSFTETDPVFTASAASGITSTNISNWNTVYGWGNHASAGYAATSSLSSYLPLTGGTITRTDTDAELTIQGYNSYDAVLTLKSNQGAITSEGAQIWYDNSVGDLHIHTTYTSDDSSIRFYTRTGTNKGQSNERLRIQGNGPVRAFIDMRAPIFYDENDTNYYVDPNSTSRLAGVKANSIYNDNASTSVGVGWYTIATNSGSRAFGTFVITDYTGGKHQSVKFTASHHYGQGNAIVVTHNDWYSGSPIRYIRIKEGATYDGAMLQVYFDASSSTSVYLNDNFQGSGWAIKNYIPDGTDPGNLGNFGALTNVAVQVDVDQTGRGGMLASGNVVAQDTMQATVYYDYDNTAYYVDPASTSNVNVINGVTLNGSDVYTTGGWFRNHTNTNGVYWSTTGWHLYPKNSSDFYLRSGASDASIQFMRSGTASSYIHNSSASDIGFLTTGRSWSFRVDNSGNNFATASSRAPIFYDSNDTNFYIDPNSSGYSMSVNGAIKFGSATAESQGGFLGRHGPGGSLNTDAYPSPLYSIGDNYRPSGTGLSNHYGVGYAHTNASFFGLSGQSGWGLFVSSDGHARVQLSGSNGTISCTGDVIAYASDGRLKENVTPIENALDKVKAIRGVTYDWVSNIKEEYDFHPTKMHEVGVIAQEVQEVLPEIVSIAPFDMLYSQKTGWTKIQKKMEAELGREVTKAEAKTEYEKLSREEQEELQDHHDFLTVNYERLTALLIEAVKEQQTQIEELKNLINK